jgi:hypothetical protein
MISYQPDIDMQQEVRQVGEWQVHLPVAAGVVSDIRCRDDVASWLTGIDLPSQEFLEEQQPAPTLEQNFREQAKKWDRETAHLSSPAQRFSHASYIAILGMANDNRDKVIDLLLRDMKNNRREWFWA